MVQAHAEPFWTVTQPVSVNKRFVVLQNPWEKFQVPLDHVDICLVKRRAVVHRSCLLEGHESLATTE